MADQLPSPDDDGIQWTKGTSKNGVPFKYGVKITEDSAKSEAAVGEGGQVLAADDISTFDYPVHWPVGDSTWKPVSNVNRITRYALFRVSSDEFQLKFTNTSGFGFGFTDESGDTYRISTVLNRDHSLQYRSPRPTIVSVNPW